MQLKRLILSFLEFEAVITFADKQHMLKRTEVAHKNHLLLRRFLFVAPEMRGGGSDS